MKHSEINDKARAFIKFRRKQLGYTQEELAVKIYGNDIKNARQRVSHIENNPSKGLGLKTLQKYLTALDAEINFITR